GRALAPAGTTRCLVDSPTPPPPPRSICPPGSRARPRRGTWLAAVSPPHPKWAGGRTCSLQALPPARVRPAAAWPPSATDPHHVALAAPRGKRRHRASCPALDAC